MSNSSRAAFFALFVAGIIYLAIHFLHYFIKDVTIASGILTIIGLVSIFIYNKNNTDELSRNL